MMKNEEIGNALNALGFMSGFAITDETITLWENEQPQPSDLEIANGAILWKEKQSKLLADAKASKEAAQAKLAALGLTTDDLKALGL